MAADVNQSAGQFNCSLFSLIRYSWSAAFGYYSSIAEVNELTFIGLFIAVVIGIADVG